MTTEDLIARLRGYKGQALCLKAADALEALGREVAELKQKMFDESEAMVSIVQVKYPQALAEREQARAELAAIRAQEPVMYGLQAATGRYGHFAYSTKEVADLAVRESPEGIGYKAVNYYASPADKDAGLVADARYQEIREALENLMAWQVKNVKVWNHPTWDNAQAVIDRHNASPKIGGV